MAETRRAFLKSLENYLGLKSYVIHAECLATKIPHLLISKTRQYKLTLFYYKSWAGLRALKLHCHSLETLQLKQCSY